MTVIAFAFAAGLAAVVRAQLGQLGWRGTLIANLAGAFALGWLLSVGPTGETATVLGVGFCGSLTTMSTFALDATGGTRREMLIVIASTVAGGLIAVAVGRALH